MEKKVAADLTTNERKYLLRALTRIHESTTALLQGAADNHE